MANAPEELALSQLDLRSLNEKLALIGERIRNLDAQGFIPESAVIGLVDDLEGMIVASATVTHLNAVPGNQTLLAANGSRKIGTEIANRTNQTLYVKYGKTATSKDWSEIVPRGATLTMDEVVYTGRVDGYIPGVPSGEITTVEMI